MKEFVTELIKVILYVGAVYIWAVIGMVIGLYKSVKQSNEESKED